jgi:hypothetical protein
VFFRRFLAFCLDSQTLLNTLRRKGDYHEEDIASVGCGAPSNDVNRFRFSSPNATKRVEKHHAIAKWRGGLGFERGMGHFCGTYGPLAKYGKYPQIIKITQTGNSFLAIRMIDDPDNLKGSQALDGEIDKSGIKKVTMNCGSGLLLFEAKGQVSDDGNKIIIDDGVHVRFTLTRK